MWNWMTFCCIAGTGLHRRKTLSSHIATALVLFVIWSPTAPAQTPEDAVVTAIEYTWEARSDQEGVVTTAHWVLDPVQLATSLRPGSSLNIGRHDSRWIKNIAGRIGAVVGSKDEYASCPDYDVTKCTLGGAAVVFAISRPQMKGDRAVVVVDVTYIRTTARAPLSGGTDRVELARKEDGWVVVGTTPMRSRG